MGRSILVIILLAVGPGWAFAQLTTGGATDGNPPAQGATGGARIIVNPPVPLATPVAPSGPGVPSATPGTESNVTTGAAPGRTNAAGQPCNPAATGATGGSSMIIVTPQNPQTSIASDRTGPTSPSNTGANLNPVPLTSGAGSTTPGC